MIGIRFASLVLCAASLLGSVVCAQEAPKPEKKNPSSTLKVQVTFTEYDGEKKLANLPYAFFVQAGDGGPHSPWTKVRMGNRVPITTGGEGGKTAFQYIDIGTNIDARGVYDEDGRLELLLNLERSWVEGDVKVEQVKQPVIRQFKTELTLPIKDGQSIQATQAPDPVSGKMSTITVVVSVLK
jgi:hypothetical protein